MLPRAGRVAGLAGWCAAKARGCRSVAGRSHTCLPARLHGWKGHLRLHGVLQGGLPTPFTSREAAQSLNNYSLNVSVAPRLCLQQSARPWECVQLSGQALGAQTVPELALPQLPQSAG